MSDGRSTSAKPVMGWVGWAGADAIGRLLILGGATIVFSRLLDPEDFGVSAIVLAIAMSAGLLVGAPFEDALAQKKVLRSAHLRSALGFSILVWLALFAISLLAAPALAAAYDAPDMALLLPVAMFSVIFAGHSDLVTARVRRLHRFNDLAAANLLSNAIAVVAAIAAAFWGAGVWSLIILRLVTVVSLALLLQARVGYPLAPLLSASHLKDLRRIAGISSLDKLTDNLTYLVFNNLVGMFFGMAVLGHANMAMRLVEPIRGAVMATVHNLTFPHFRRVAQRAEDAEARDMPIALLAFVIAPVFAGLAAVTPAMIPLVAGPGWDTAVPIAICLALGAALTLPALPISTALFAAGRPEYSLIGNIIRLAVTSLFLVLLRDASAVAVGAARLAGDAAQTLFAVLVPLGFMHWPPLRRLMLLLPAWLISGAMALGASAVLYWLRPFGDAAALVGAVAAGIAIQPTLMFVLRRKALFQLLGFVRPTAGGQS